MEKRLSFWINRSGKYGALAIFISLYSLMSCDSEKKKKVEVPVQNEKVLISAPEFNADSAYSYIAAQVAFGPRVPNTEEHVKAGNFLKSQLETFGWQVTEQQFDAVTFDNQKLYLRNIIASFKPEISKRILLAAHWDTRPFADKDDERKNEPILGANDGASGVGVLLEIARILSKENDLSIGVDIIFFDGEDWGETEGQRTRPTNGLESWWCLGSQYWSKNKHQANYSAFYGILLDMVGGKNARFYIEEYSKQKAPSIVDKVWNTGAKIGYSEYFIKQPGGAITDDHYFVNNYAKIPMIDIIPMDPKDGSFGDFHHTHDDNMEIISKETLKAVGQTVLTVLYNE